MSKATGYSLWIVPEIESEAYEFLDKLIFSAATYYLTPVFKPHVTLLGGIEGKEQDMREKTRQLAEKLAPYEIQLSQVASNGTYFQILFSWIEQTPAVMNANAISQQLFAVDKGKYLPHLSLVYGDLSKEQVVALQQFVARGKDLAGIRFLAKSIELWHSEGSVEEWKKVVAFPLGKS